MDDFRRHGARIPDRHRFIAASAWIFALLLFLPALAVGQTVDRSAAQGVVQVNAVIPGDARTARSLGTARQGSGVVIDSSGLIVTIGYLILEATEVTITGASDEAVPATIVAYDHRTREAVMDDLGQAVESQASDRGSWVGSAMSFLRDLPRTWRLDKIGYTAAGVVTVMLGVAVGSLARLLILRRRKLVALQLTSVPRTKRRGMTRKLRFYLRMLEMLERHGHVRPAWQSPFQFATDLSGRYPARFDAVVALTEVFYEVRFGHRDLDEPRRARVKTNLRALERGLASREA